MSERNPRRVSRDAWQPSPRQITNGIAAALQAISTLTPEERSDYKLLIDTVEGQSDLLEILDRIAEQRESDKLFIAQIQKRLRRFKKRADKAKELFRKIAEKADLPDGVERPFYTEILADDPQHAHIIDESQLPRHVLRPDLQDITARLKRGEEITGAMLNNPGSRHIVLRFS